MFVLAFIQVIFEKEQLFIETKPKNKVVDKESALNILVKHRNYLHWIMKH